MAGIEGISIFSREGVDLPNNNIEAPASSFASSLRSPDLSPEFLSLYNAIIGYISQYEVAFEEENFNRMVKFATAINNKIISYFKGSGILLPQLRKIADNTTEKAKELLEKKRHNSLDFDKVQDKISELVSDYKEKILQKIKGLALAYSSPTSEKESGTKEASLKTTSVSVSDKKQITANTISFANDLLKKREKAFRENVSKFSVTFGKTILTNFIDVLSKVNAENLDSFKKNLDVLDKEYKKTFFIVVRKSVIPKTTRTLSEKTKIFLKGTLKGTINLLTLGLAGLLKIYFGGRALLKFVKFWGGKLLAPVVWTFNIAKKLIVGAVNVLWNVGKFAVKSIYGIASFAAKTVIRTFKTIYSLSDFVFSKVLKVSILGIFKKAFVGFIMSYPGAYFLGYVVGRIWGSILKIAGLSTTNIQNGEYSVKDDVLKPWLETIKNRAEKAMSNVKDVFDQKEAAAKGFKEKIKEVITSSRLWREGNYMFKVAANFPKALVEQITDFYEKVAPFFNNYVIPVAEALWSVVGMFVEGAIAEPKIFKRAYIGAKAGLKAVKLGARMTKFINFAKYVISRGGLAAIMAGGVAAGAAAILGQTDKTYGEQGDKKDSFMKIGVSKKYSDLWGGEETEESKEDVKNHGGYQTVSQRSKAFLGNLLKTADRTGDPEVRKQYDEIEAIYLDIINEQMVLQDASAELERYSIEYEKARSDGAVRGSLDGSTLWNTILKYNGKLLVNRDILKKNLGEDVKIQLYKTILNARLMDVNNRLAQFEKDGDNSLLRIASNRNIDSDGVRKIAEGARQLAMPKTFHVTGYDIDKLDVGSDPGGNLSVNLTGYGQKTYEKEATEDKSSRLMDAMNIGFQVNLNQPQTEETEFNRKYNSELKELQRKQKDSEDSVRWSFFNDTWVKANEDKARHLESLQKGNGAFSVLNSKEKAQLNTLLQEREAAFQEWKKTNIDIKFSGEYDELTEKSRRSIFVTQTFPAILAQLAGIAFAFTQDFIDNITKTDILVNVGLSASMFQQQINQKIIGAIRNFTPDTLLEKLSKEENGGESVWNSYLKISQGVFTDALKELQMENKGSPLDAFIQDFKERENERFDVVRTALAEQEQTERKTIDAIRELLGKYAEKKAKEESSKGS